jgi:hypothetical protein
MYQYEEGKGKVFVIWWVWMVSWVRYQGWPCNL